MQAVKKLSRIGNSYGLIIPKEMLKTARINPRQGCRVSAAKGRLTVVPLREEAGLDDEVASAMLRFMRKYRFDLAKLGVS